ncbi:MAG: Ig-like domain-containing protein [Bacteroidales bacterium]|nr:Ig-like domain-containing protein [Bacteroidales bacterium]
MRKIALILPFIFLCACKQEIPLKNLHLSATELQLPEGKDSLLTATLAPGNASATVTWTSMDEHIATVDESGRVRGIYGGRTFILAQAGPLKKGCAVTVFAQVERIAFQESSPFRIRVGKSAVLHVDFFPERALNHKLSWQSSNEEIVAVNGGVLVGNALGTAIVTAVSEDNPEAVVSCTVEVVPKSEEPQPPVPGDIESLEEDNHFDNWDQIN